MEIEVKFRAGRTIRAEEVEGVALSPFTLGPCAIHELRDTLLDSAQRQLSGQRWALRVRQDGAHYWLTLKGPSTVTDDGTHRREEWEEPLPATAPLDPATWPATLRARVAALTGGAPVAPLLAIQNQRRAWPVWLGGREVAEIVLDEGLIRARHAALPMHEIEIELKGDGDEAHLAQLSALLSAALPLEPEPRSKSQRGLALLDGDAVD